MSPKSLLPASSSPRSTRVGTKTVACVVRDVGPNMAVVVQRQDPLPTGPPTDPEDRHRGNEAQPHLAPASPGRPCPPVEERTFVSPESLGDTPCPSHCPTQCPTQCRSSTSWIVRRPDRPRDNDQGPDTALCASIYGSRSRLAPGNHKPPGNVGETPSSRARSARWFRYTTGL